MQEVENRTDQLMKQFQEELLRKKNSIIENLQSTEKSLLDKVNTNPRLWGKECFKFILNSQATLVLNADLNIQDRAEPLEISNDEEKDTEEISRQDELFRQLQETETLRKIFKYLRLVC